MAAFTAANLDFSPQASMEGISNVVPSQIVAPLECKSNALVMQVVVIAIRKQVCFKQLCNLQAFKILYLNLIQPNATLLQISSTLMTLMATITICSVPTMPCSTRSVRSTQTSLTILPETGRRTRCWLLTLVAQLFIQKSSIGTLKMESLRTGMCLTLYLWLF